MSKTKSNAVLLNLPEEQQAKLADWLLGGMPYHEAKVLVEKEFGVQLKSLSAFVRFWREVCAVHLLAKRQRLGTTADARAEQARLEPGKFDAATLDALKQKAYELAESPNAEPKEIKAVMGLLLKAQELALDRDRFKRETCELFIKWCADQEAKTIATSTASNADKIEQLGKKMFGEDWD